MKSIAYICFLLLSGVVFSQNSINNIIFDKVLIYKFEGGKGGDLSVIDKQGNFAKSISKKVELDSKTIQTLNRKLLDKKSYGAGEAFCYEPRLGIVYFYKSKVVAKIDICLECNRLVSSFEIEAQKQGKQIDNGDVFYVAQGLSDDFKGYLKTLIKEKGF